MVYSVHTPPTPEFSTELQRDNTVYVSNVMDDAIVFKTPVVTLTTPLIIGDELQDFVELKFKKAHLDVFEVIEKSLRTVAMQRKGDWFKNDDLSDDVIQHAFKSFINHEAKTLRVRVDDGIATYTTCRTRCDPPIGTGVKVKAVLELHRATFTKTQFGAIWTLKQLKWVDDVPSPYLFDPDDAPEVDHITENALDDQTILAAYDDVAQEM